MRSNNYILEKVKANQYQFLLISTDMSRLEDYITDVEKDLIKLNSKGNVIFDLLLNNSMDDRFYQCYFDGIKFNLRTLSQVNPDNLDKQIIKMSSSFYCNNFDLFEDLFYSNDYKLSLRDQLSVAL